MNNMNITLSTWAGRGGKRLSQTEALKVIAAPRTVTGVFCLTQKTLLCVFILSAWLPFLQPFYSGSTTHHQMLCQSLENVFEVQSSSVATMPYFPTKKRRKNAFPDYHLP